jgi:GNAT superfamily N-acetyltransferase
VLALAGDAVVGYVFAHVRDADTCVTGVRTTLLGQIGVPPSVRGRGVATATIVAALSAAAADGCGKAALDVDTENPRRRPRPVRAGRLPHRPHLDGLGVPAGTGRLTRPLARRRGLVS